MSENPSLKQVATRIPEDDFEVLKIGMVLTGAHTMQELLQPVVAAYVEELREQPEVKRIQEDAQAFRDRSSGVTRIRSTNKDSKSSPSQAGEKS